MKCLLLLGIVCLTLHASHSIPADCLLEPDEGEGNNMIRAVYYDSERDQCRIFSYAGEKGNANRFTNERECIRACSPKVDEVYPLDARMACTFKKLPGVCDGNQLRYYYDPIHDKCKTFYWTGCLGNGNRFIDDKSCNSTCYGIHVDGDEAEEDEPDTPVAIICGVVIGLIVVAIIVTVTVLTLRSKKKSKASKGKSKDAQTERPLQSSEIEMA